MKPTFFRYAVLVCCLLLNTVLVSAQKIHNKPRVVITTDGEVDDMDSFIRLLLYSNELNIVGLVYSSSEFHYAGDGKGTPFTSAMPFAKKYGTRTNLRWLGTTWMQSFIDRYATVYPNLRKHDANYPSPRRLKSLVRIGNIDFESEMDHDTEGSDFIKKLLLDADPAPLFFPVWGGTNTVARALKSIEDQYKGTPQWEAIQKKVSAKATLYIILDQDQTYQKYLSANWPDLTILLNRSMFWCFAYLWDKTVPKPYLSYLDGPWHKEHIKFGHGALASSYFLWGDGQKLANDSDHTQGDTAEALKNNMKKYAFISEGDSPSFLYLLNTGLRNLENPGYGGWGARFERSKQNPHLWVDATAPADYNGFTKKADAHFSQTRWIEALQNDFAARADWCVKPFSQANHPPQATLAGRQDISAKPGAAVRLTGLAKDPDGNAVTFRWWQYAEAGTCSEKVSIQNPGKATATFTVPANARKDETIHLVLEVTDNGSPALTRYRRVVVTVL
ncbi:DUF1593 domain-containing protein [Sediminibacterium soli]|uniref:DUF1593 domain-containing protein n=1 Tax=Sediminibacterium soli TaxID=2698829 RepID=UPI001379EE0F|nr:DUF1593 domain-containing protein [Sediminibacterium soli]NCI48198.1 DUF1593 domain-containing protein [Sediminibacterium soli]